MIKFLKEIFTSYETSALQILERKKQSINAKGGSAKYLEDFLGEWVQIKERNTFLIIGVITDGRGFDAYDIKLAALKQLCIIRGQEKLRNSLDTSLSPKSDNVQDELNYVLISSIYKLSACFITPSDDNDLKNSNEFKNLECDSVEDALAHALYKIAEKLFNNIADRKKQDAADIMEELIAKDEACHFFRTMAIKRMSKASLAFDQWENAELETLQKMVKGMN